MYKWGNKLHGEKEIQEQWDKVSTMMQIRL